MRSAHLALFLLAAAPLAREPGDQHPLPALKGTLRPALGTALPILSRGEKLILEVVVVAPAGAEVDRAVLAGNALRSGTFGPVAPLPRGQRVRLAPGTRIVRSLAVPREWFHRRDQAGPRELPRARLRWESPTLVLRPREFLYLDEEVRSARVELKTRLGAMTLALDPVVAPDHVKTFLFLARSGFYDGTRFYRVIKDFLIQGGCPNSRDEDPSDDGKGSGPWTLRAEFSTRPMRRGALAMARDPRDPDSASCHFFILQARGEQTQLNGKYTLFGRLLWGEETLDRIAGVATGGPRGETPEEPVPIVKARVVYPE